MIYTDVEPSIAKAATTYQTTTKYDAQHAVDLVFNVYMDTISPGDRS